MIVFFVLMAAGIFINNFIMILAILVLPIMFLLFRINSTKEKELTTNQAINIFKQHEISKYHIGTDNLSAIGLNENQNKIVLLTRNKLQDNFNVNPLPFSDILETKLIEDELTVTSVSRASQIGGAIVGGMVAGGIGAIVGGSGATSHTENDVRKIQLELVVDSLDNPVHRVSFMNEDIHIKKYETKYKQQFETASQWYKMFSVILKRNEKEYKYS